jgi:ATP-binding cassette, subfamily B, bacterial
MDRARRRIVARAPKRAPKRAPSAILTIVRLVRPRMRSYLTGLIVFTFAEVSFYVSIPLAMKIMIDAAIGRDLPQLWRGVFLILAVSAAGAVCFVLFMYLFCVAVYRITAHTRKEAFRHAVDLPAAYFERNHSGDILSRLTNDINALRNSYDWPLWNLLVTLLAGSGAAAAMIILDRRASIFLLASSVAFTLLNMRFAGSIKRLSAEIQKTAGELTESMGNILGGFAVIRQFGLRKRMGEELEVHNRRMLDLSMARVKKSAWLDAYNTLIGWINFGGILALGAFLAGRKLMAFGTMVALVNYLWNVNRMIRETGSGIAQFHGYMAGAERVLELGREAEEGTEAPPESYSRAESGGPVVEMRNVSFSYDGNTKALDGFDLTAGEGQTIALVGPSGGGKTTVLKLLLGFHLPSEGAISLRVPGSGGLSLGEIREAMAYVPQEPFMFDGTIAENIGYGNLGAGADGIIEAARRAHAHDFISRLEKGYDTLAGERGVKLSGGQKQRIAIARAFLKDAPVLLLDEATSSLDSASEQGIQAALRDLGDRKTVIVVAHRLSTIEGADAICVVDRGAVVEKGSHEELLARNGLYRKLYEIQFAPGGVAEE